MTWRRTLYLLPLAGFIILAAYFYHSLASGYDPELLPSAMINKPAPSFELIGLNGAQPLTNSEFADKIVFINFFASWCAPCREESPILMDLARGHVIQLYGIDYKDKPADAIKYLQEFGNPYRKVGVDETGRTAINFGVYGVPETYAIDRTGRIRWRFVGPLTEHAVRTQLLPLLKKLGAS